MMTWVALAFTTGTLSVLSVADDRVTAGEETLASPSSTCSRGERQGGTEQSWGITHPALGEEATKIP